jgi:hypothetical protein
VHINLKLYSVLNFSLHFQPQTQLSASSVQPPAVGFQPSALQPRYGSYVFYIDSCARVLTRYGRRDELPRAFDTRHFRVLNQGNGTDILIVSVATSWGGGG